MWLYDMDQFGRIGRRASFIGIGALAALIIACGSTSDEVVITTTASTLDATDPQSTISPSTSTASVTVVPVEEP